MKVLALLLSSLFLVIHAPSASAQTSAGPNSDNAQMAQARTALKKNVGGQSYLFVMADRLEYQTGDTESAFWDVQGWYGGDLNRFWFKSEGEYSYDTNEIEEADLQLLYSQAISPFFDLQAGVRQDLGEGPQHTWAVIGVQGLAPYWFEVDAFAYVNGEGNAIATLETEYEILLTQRLILQPSAELSVSFQDIEEMEIGSGLSEIEAGVRLRYEIKRELAPYVGLSWKRSYGGTANFLRSSGEDLESISLVAGLRVWF